jgi:pimeloyl-ACP methyl ester carboxylesterase
MALAPQQLTGIELSALLRHEYIDSRSGQLHLSTLREPQHGEQAERLVLMNTRSRSLRALLPLVGEWADPVIVDIPGTGPSSPISPGQSMEDVADDIADSLERWGVEKADFFGFHTGSKIVAAIAARRPAMVRRLVVAGKTHSVIPEKDARVAAMQGYVDRGGPDSSIVELEGRYVDDGGAVRHGRRLMYAANFGFGFEEALATVQAPTLVLEVTTPDEDALHGRHGRRLAERMPNATAVELAQTSPVGFEMFIGHDALAAHLRSFLT